MKRTLLAAIALAVALTAATSAGAAITAGPYLLNPARTSITVAWVTDDSAPGVVEFFSTGVDAREETSVPAAFEIGNVRTDWHHHVTLYGLESDAAYTYTVESGGDTRGPLTFETAPPNTEPFHFVAYGDTRGARPGAPNPDHQAVMAAFSDYAPPFHINTGDLVSAGEDYTLWDAFFDETEALVAESALVPVYGNHEDGFDEELDLSGADNWARFFPLPGDGRARMWYSFDYANVHFVVLNMTLEYTLWTEDSPQRRWLVADLEAASVDPHHNLIVLVFHQPAYSWKPDRNPSFAASAIVAPMAERYGVDLVLCGHNHHYARAEIRGVQHVTTGGGGASLYEFVDDVEQEPGYRAHALAFHYCLVEADSESLHVTAFGVPGGEVLDEFTVPAHRDLVPEDEEPADDDAADDDAVDDDDDDDDDAQPPDDDLADPDDPGGDDDGCF